jgi:hypothetical protein
MAEKQEDSRGESLARATQNSATSDRTEELTWSFLDEQISDDEFHLLEKMLLGDTNCRKSYIGCVQLHADLISHFAASTDAGQAKGQGSSPVLGFLGPDSSLNLQSPSGEQAIQ